MKKLLDFLKDFLYDSVDYIIVIGIVGLVVIIIGWRIDLLFANDVLSSIDEPGLVVDNDLDKDIDNLPLHDGGDNDHVSSDKTDGEDTDKPDQTPDNNSGSTENPATVMISIPSGSLPSNIASILESKGLITNKDEFIRKSQELKLDTKLKSGNFNIALNTSLEDIIYLISK